jgi:hypothetical protein
MGAAIQARTDAKNRQAREHLAKPGALTFDPQLIRDKWTPRIPHLADQCYRCTPGTSSVVRIRSNESTWPEKEEFVPISLSRNSHVCVYAATGASMICNPSWAAFCLR